MANVRDKSAARAPRVTVPGSRFHRVRKTIQTICVVIFILLPLFNVVRFDLPRQRFYFFGAELWISEFSIIFLSLMFMMVTIAAVAMIYGRIYCGYLCPQMIFSEAATSLETRINRMVKRRLPGLGPVAGRSISIAIFSLVLLPASVFVTFVFVSFFVEPRDLFHRLLTLDIRSAGGIVGASVTLLTLLDFAFLRQRFCTAICPYGYLQGMLADSHTLLVHYQDDAGKCIKCEKCVHACPMGIDIRKSSRQLECIHCAECIDACSTVLGRLGRASMIQYAWGEPGKGVTVEHAWYRRLGLRDGKRVAILVLLLLYATGLSIAINMRQPVLVRIMPDRITLYTRGTDGLIHNRFRLMVSNRGKSQASVTLRLADLPAAQIYSMPNDVTLKPGETLQREFDIAAAATAVGAGVNHLRIVAHVTTGQADETFAETFIAPMEAAGQPKPEDKQK
jgi:cytochrome c oxidase accessory protein FixG